MLYKIIRYERPFCERFSVAFIAVAGHYRNAEIKSPQMKSSIVRKSILIASALFCFVIAAMASDGQSKPNASAPYSSLGRTPLGREVKASADVPVGVRVQGETLAAHFEDAHAIKFDNHVLFFERERLLLDGKVRAKISASTMSFQVVFTNQLLSVRAGTNLVLSAKVGK